MKRNLFKRGMAGLLSLVMCLTALVGLGTTTAFAAGEQAEVYLISFPRSGDANLDYGGSWGHPNLQYMNGWYSGNSKYTTIRAMHSYEGNICYCIEPGTAQETGDRYTSKDETFWDNLPADFNSTISPYEMKLFIGRIIGFKSISFDKSLCKEPVKASDGKISVLVVEPNKYPKMIEIDDTLEAMQTVVGGDIEEYMPFEDEVAIICNEDGKVNGLPPNRAVYDENSREMQDIICGKFFIVHAPFDSEKFQSLPPALAEKYREKFKYPERFMRAKNEIVAVPFKPIRADKER